MKLLDDSPKGQKELQQTYSNKKASEMRGTFWIAMIMIILGISAMSLSSCNDNPDSEGAHWDYSVVCEGGFKYKSVGTRGAVILMLNSDGTALRCDKERY